MDIVHLQNKVSAFVENNNIETSVEARLLDLVSELGELSKEFLKGSKYGKDEFIETQDWENEFGDVLFTMICIANSTDINIETALKKALNKYKKRSEQKGEISSGN